VTERSSDSTDEIPEGPTGVWLEYEGGERYDNLPTIYVGQTADGVHNFRVLAPKDDVPVAAGCAKLPGMTGLQIPALRIEDR